MLFGVKPTVWYFLILSSQMFVEKEPPMQLSVFWQELQQSTKFRIVRFCTGV